MNNPGRAISDPGWQAIWADWKRTHSSASSTEPWPSPCWVGFSRITSLWRDCGWLNGWDVTANETFESYLEAWAEHLQAQGTRPRVPALVEGLFSPAQSATRD